MAEVSKYLLALIAALTWLHADAFVASVEEAASGSRAELGIGEAPPSRSGESDERD